LVKKPHVVGLNFDLLASCYRLENLFMGGLSGPGAGALWAAG
jgi:hypothetical protein